MLLVYLLKLVIRTNIYILLIKMAFYKNNQSKEV